MKRFLHFNWLLDLRINSPMIVLIFIFPIYVIWLYKIGSLGEQIVGHRTNWFFKLLCIFWFASIIITFGLLQYIQDNSPFMTTLHPYADLLSTINIFLSVFSWLYCSFYAMQLFIKINELKDEEYYPTITDKLNYFFQIFYWIFGLWVIQPKINALYEEWMEAQDTVAANRAK